MDGVRLICIFLLLWCTIAVSSQDCRPQNDSMVLVDFFGATKGTSWKKKWDLNKNFKDWHGISVNQSGCVTSIVLVDNGLQGNIPDLNLPFLEKLDISGNNMLSTLPPFSKMKSLKHLNVSQNRFQGAVPSLANSPKMEVLIAFNNQLNGQIPDYQHAMELKILNLANNKLTGNIELINNHPKLTHLNLSNNSLQGTIPALKDIAGLVEIDLSQNKLTGSIPFINGLSKLTIVNLSENMLSGSFLWPMNVPELLELKVSHNRLSDTLSNTGSVGKLTKFYASDNQFTGRIPDMQLPDLQELLLSQNQLTGSVPDFSGLPMLQQFSVRLNELANIDFEPAFLNRIAFADVSENRLTFQDLIPFRNFRGSTITLFPQKTVSFITESFTVTKGNNYTIELSTDENDGGTVFQWYKDDQRLNVNADRKFFISNIIPRDAGNYMVIMTNSQYPGFPIMSESFTLFVDCPEVIEERKVYLCPGDIFPYKGIVYRQDTMFADTVATQNDFVCDSLYLIEIISHHPDTVHAESELCEGDIYYFGPDSIQLTRSGTYIDTFPNIGGCDSVVTLDLTFRPSYREVKNVGLCPGDSLIHHDNVYYENVDLVDTFTSIFGCDSIVTMKVRFSDPVRTLTQYDLCQGDSVLIDGQYYASSIVWTDTLSARGGCDSIATVRVAIHDAYEETINVRICTPDTYDWQGRQLSSSGKFSDTLISEFGCDSIVHLNLTVSSSYFSRDTMFICEGDSVFFNGSYLNDSGIYFSDKTSSMGCDSVDVLEIRFHDYAEMKVVEEICMGDTLKLNDKIYMNPGIFSDTFYSDVSCDTLVTVVVGFTNLVITDSTIVGTGSTDSSGSVSVTISGGSPPYNYRWSTGDTTEMIDSVQAGDYMLTVTDSVGCVADFKLTVPVMSFVWQPVEKKSWIRVRPNYLDRRNRTSVYLDVEEEMRGSSISLFNEMGQEMSRRKIDVLESGQSLIWELGNYKAGMYYFHIREKGTPAFQVERLMVF